MSAPLHAGSSGRVPVPPEKRFLISSAVAVSILRLVRKSEKDRALRKLMKHVVEQCQK
jgi:hypothetical protein